MKNYDTTIDQALAVIEASPIDTPVILDLDETLLLESSSELFLNTVRPALPGRLLLLALDWIKPWRWLGGERHRDLVRILAVRLLFPWTILLWRRRCGPVAAQYTNHALLRAIAGRPKLIVTFGYRPIVTPIANAILPDVPLVSSGLRRRDRDLGKLVMLQAQAADFPLTRSIVITDSMDDADLLAAVAHPLRVVWPQAAVRAALRHVYLPLYYMEKLRRPGERYFVRGVIQDELIVVLLAAMPLAVAPFPLALGLCFLCLSFWCIYEQGYADNDVLSRRYETEHVRPLTEAHRIYGAPYLWAVLWSMALAVPGLLLTARGTGGNLRSLAVEWSIVLIVVAAYFTVYNRIERRGRNIIFSGLHALRAFALATVAAISVPGFMMLISSVVGRQIEDYVHKRLDRTAPTPDLFLIRLQLYLVFTLSYAVVFRSQGRLFWIDAAILFAYGLVRTRSELNVFLSGQLRWVWSRSKS